MWGFSVSTNCWTGVVLVDKTQPNDPTILPKSFSLAYLTLSYFCNRNIDHNYQKLYASFSALADIEHKSNNPLFSEPTLPVSSNSRLSKNHSLQVFSWNGPQYFSIEVITVISSEIDLNPL